MFMRDHYHGFSHPVLVDLPLDDELVRRVGVIADELRDSPKHVPIDDEIAFIMRVDPLRRGVLQASGAPPSFWVGF
jgi:hypothetical protein